MTCTCKADIEAKLLEGLKKNTPTGSDHDVRFTNYGMVIRDNALVVRPYANVDIRVILPKRSGGYRPKRRTECVFFKFCPHCGVPVDGATTQEVKS